MSRPDKSQPPAQQPEEWEFLISGEVMETLSIGFTVLDFEWRYRYINRTTEEILGRPRSELIGKVVWEEFPEILGTETEEVRRRTMTERTPGQIREFYPGLGWIEERTYPADEGIWIIAQAAIDRYDDDHSAEAARWSHFLAEAEHTFTASLDDLTILDTLVHLAVPALADAAGAARIGKDGKIHHIALALTETEREGEVLQILRRYPLDLDLDLAVPRTLRTGEAEIIPRFGKDFLEKVSGEGEAYTTIREFEVCSAIAAPLVARGRSIAAIWLVSMDPDHKYDAVDLARARDLAGRAALAVDNATLYKDLQRAERNARLLVEAGAALAISLDYEVSLQNLARLITPSLADYCIIDIVEGGHLRKVATAHTDPELDRLLRETRAYPPDSRESPCSEVIATGVPRLITEVSDTDLDEFAPDPAHRSILATLDPTSIILVPLTARGQTFGVITLSVTGDRQYDSDDLSLAEDLAHRTALMIDNARLYHGAVEANRAKSDFLAVISHELRTPLNAIMGYTDLLVAGVTGPLTDAQTEQLGRIDLSARHLLDLIEEVLTFSRMEMGREDIQVKQVDLSSLLREVASRVEPLAHDRGLAFELELPPDQTLIETDSAKLRQIVSNLLSNAVKFTDQGRISLGTEVTDSSVLIRVADTGVGIEPEEIARLFEPFWQHDRGTTRRVTGTGLGLSVSERLASLLGGSIEVESVPGTGSTFTLHLPRYGPDSTIHDDERGSR